MRKVKYTENNRDLILLGFSVRDYRQSLFLISLIFSNIMVSSDHNGLLIVLYLEWSEIYAIKHIGCLKTKALFLVDQSQIVLFSLKKLVFYLYVLSYITKHITKHIIKQKQIVLLKNLFL